MSTEKVTALESAVSSSGLPRAVRLYLAKQLRDYKLGKLEQTASLLSRVTHLVSLNESSSSPLVIKSAFDACVLAIHVAFLDAGLQCLGLKTGQIVPDSWFTSESSGVSSNEFATSYEMTNTTGWSLKFNVTFVMVGSWQLVLSASRAGSPTVLDNSTLEFDVQKLVAPSVFSSAAAISTANQSIFPLRIGRQEIGWEKHLQVILSPLTTFPGSDQIVGPLDDFLVKFGVKEKEKDSSASTSSSSSANSNNTSTAGGSRLLVTRPVYEGGGSSGLMGIPSPRTGIAGDFERDMFPDVGGLRPGGLLGSGNLVGPAHPLFHPSPGGHFGGGLPQGVPPGARFDPFLPPGIMPRGGFGGGGRGRGGGGFGGGFGPNPNHLRPPPDDDDAPPDIYY